MNNRKLKYAAVTLGVTTALVLNGCAAYTPQEEDMIASVVTAMPSEVVGCTFVGDVNNHYGAVNLESARRLLKLKTAQLGGNHLVETNMSVMPGFFFYDDGPFLHGPSGMAPTEFFLSGRAYSCPTGKGVLRAPETIKPKRSELLKGDVDSLPKTPAIDESKDVVQSPEPYDDSLNVDGAKPAAQGSLD